MLIINNKKGFTLVEIIIAAGVLVGAIVLMVTGAKAYFDIIEQAKNTAIATYAAEGKMEEVRNLIEELNTIDDNQKLQWIIDYYNITFSNRSFNPFNYYNNTTSLANYANGRGVIKITGMPIGATPPQWIDVHISVCWAQVGNRTSSIRRIVGEDKNLNGVLDPGEDKNSNGLIDSPVELDSSFTLKW